MSEKDWQGRDVPENEHSECPRCGRPGLCRDSVDVGVGVINGPWGCPCGWSEDERYDLQSGGGVQPDGTYIDQYGGLLPACNPVAIMRLQEATHDPA